MPGDLFDGLSGAVVSDAPSLDDITLPSGGDLTCEVCGTELIYAGRGRKPRFCADHKPGKSTSRTASTPRTRRSSKSKDHPQAAGILGMGYSMAGAKLSLNATTAGGVAAGRVMQLQGPDAGARLARLLHPIIEKFTLLEKVSQGGPATDIMAIVAPPLICGFLVSNPQAFSVLEPYVGMLLGPIAQSILKAKEAQEAAAEKLFEPDEKTVEMTQSLLDQIFGGLIPQEGTPNEEA